jgi:hypothetical protein
MVSLKILEAARILGEQVDACVMAHEEGKPFDLHDIDDYENGCRMFEAWLDFRKDYPFKVIETQTPVYYPHEDGISIPRYAGTPDLIIEHEGVQRVLELKCTSRVMECHGLQAWLYHLAKWRYNPYGDPCEHTHGMPWLVRLDKAGKHYPWEVSNPVLLNYQALTAMMRYHYWENIPDKDKKGLKKVKR